jgi:copper chaperone CopZ
MMCGSKAMACSERRDAANVGRSWDRRCASTGADHNTRCTDRAVRFRAVVSILMISGMVAVHAKRAVFTALAGVPGVLSAEVDMGRAVVEHDASTTSDALREAIAFAGCEVTSVRTERRLPLTDL